MRWAQNTVKNRLNQTAEKDDQEAKVNQKWDSPPDLLTLGEHCFCINHLDAVAAQIMLCQSSNSIWLSNERENAASNWFLAGGLNPAIKKQPSAKMVIGKVQELLLPKWEIIPPVAGCAHCGGNGSHCYSYDYGPTNWIDGAKPRLDRLLEVRNAEEVVALRRVLNEIIQRVARASETGNIDFEFEARKELIVATQKARNRMERDFKKVEKYCGLLALFALTPQWVGETLSLKDATLLGLGFQSVAVAGLEAYKAFVCSRNSWISVKEIAAEKLVTNQEPPA